MNVGNASNAGMYVLRDNETLVALVEQPYDSEDLLQGLLARYPDLLAGEQMDGSNPRRWLLIAREAGLPSEDGGGARWSVDHLFLDQDGIPTLIEVKRSSDTRLRREVVGQMLDYAANAVVYWPVEALRAAFEARCAAEGVDAAQALGDFLVGGDPDGYWSTVKTNLQAGKVRLVFVADEIPTELQRIVEFLNGQMDPAEVLAVEIKQYVGEQLRTLVPRVIGQTAASANKQKSGGQSTRQWDEPSFFAALTARATPEEVQAARRIYEWLQAHAQGLWWGRGRVDGSVYPILRDPAGKPHWLISLWTTGVVTVQVGYITADQAFSSDAARRELLDRLSSIPGVSILPSRTNVFPSVPLSKLSTIDALDRFLITLDWVLQAITAAWA